MRVRRGIAAAAVLVLSSALVACGDDAPADPTAGVDGGSGAWRSSGDPVTTTPLVREADGVVHLSDGTDIELDGPTSSYVVAGDGVFFVPAASADDAASEDVALPGAPESPDGTWTLRQDGDRGTVLGADGEAVALDVPTARWTLDWWADAQTVVGVAVADDGSSALLSCRVPDGTCEVPEASTGAVVRFATGTTDQLVVRLLGADG